MSIYATKYSLLFSRKNNAMVAPINNISTVIGSKQSVLSVAVNSHLIAFMTESLHYNKEKCK